MSNLTKIASFTVLSAVAGLGVLTYLKLSEIEKSLGPVNVYQFRKEVALHQHYEHPQKVENKSLNLATMVYVRYQRLKQWKQDKERSKKIHNIIKERVQDWKSFGLADNPYQILKECGDNKNCPPEQFQKLFFDYQMHFIQLAPYHDILIKQLNSMIQMQTKHYVLNLPDELKEKLRIISSGIMEYYLQSNQQKDNMIEDMRELKKTLDLHSMADTYCRVCLS